VIYHNEIGLNRRS